ncbi:MAG: tetratricopeptide repeat protein, partial [Candidatus Omnitrophica bacterium]|nr:tetratricopeptide repeat protein [Candidatus Omnitrophota bacterium]
SGSGEYAAERLLYRALKNNQKILINPEVAPAKMLASIENDLERILKRYPKSETAKQAYIKLAEFYIANKKYDKAIATLNVIMEKYDKNQGVLSTAQFLKGATYEKQGEWDSALKEYVTLRNKFPTTQLGLQVPIYIGRYYARKGRQGEAEAAYKEALAFYEKLEGDNKGKMLGYAASMLLLQTYLGLKNHEEAGRVVKQTIYNYPSSMALVQLLPYVDVIYVKILKRSESAIEIYNHVKDKTDDAKLKKFLQKKIEELEVKK